MGDTNAYVSRQVKFTNLMPKKQKIKIFFFFLLLFLLLGAGFVFILPAFASPQKMGGIALEINYPNFPGTSPPTGNSSFPDYVKYIFDLALLIGGILALGGLIYGGILYLISTGKPDRMASAKSQINAAFFGLLILLSSYLILNTISPQFTELKLEPLGLIEIEKQQKITPPAVAEISTSIDPESSPGRIIEKIFETYISEYPEPEQKWTPRMMRLKNNTNATKEIVERITIQSKTLRDAADDCKCEDTDPDPGCNHPGCHDCPPNECTCDPCKSVRDNIQSTEQKNLNEIYIGTTVSNQMNVDWQLETIPSTLIKEMLKTEDEVRLLKEQLDRLKRAEKYVKECPLRSLHSYVQVADLRKSIENVGGVVRKIDFWNDVNIIYYRPEEVPPRYKPIPYKEKNYVFDFATFYCDVSGILEQAFYPVLSPVELTGYETEEEAEEVLSKTMACGREAVFGDFSDRVKRITQLLIDKFEKIVELDKKLIKKNDELQRAISECTSKRCIPICQKIYVHGVCVGCIEIGCFGEPCPMGKINDRFDDIKEIRDEIGFLIDGRGGDVTPENIGIITLIDEYAPQILEELEKTVRQPMKECSFEDLEKKGTVLFNCSQSKGATTPEGKMILYCCRTEETQNGVEQRTPFGDCFEECYLERNQKEHRECVNLCLVRKARELRDDQLARCIHELNFYCCNAGEY